jgi:hypothetical protein
VDTSTCPAGMVLFVFMYLHINVSRLERKPFLNQSKQGLCQNVNGNEKQDNLMRLSSWSNLNLEHSKAQNIPC